MPYFPKYNTIFIHIPKNGGTTITQLFSPDGMYSNYGWVDSLKEKDFEFKHSDYIFYSEKLKEKIQNINIFTIVRNPFERLLSYFFFHMETKTKKIITEYNNDNLSEIFEIYLKKMLVQNNLFSYKKNPYLTNKLQTDYIVDESGKINNKIKIFKYEDYFKKNKLPILNKSRYETHIKKYEIYSEQTIKIVKNYFLEDFKNFNYNTEL